MWCVAVGRLYGFGLAFGNLESVRCRIDALLGNGFSGCGGARPTAPLGSLATRNRAVDGVK